MSLIEVRNLSRVYTQGKIEVHALRGIDLDIEQAEFTALAGASGSGKTTLLNMIGCLDQPTAGSVKLDGLSMIGMRRGQAANFRLKHIGFVFQAYNLIPVLSAYENAEFVLMLQGVPKADRRKMVMPLLDAVGMADMAGRKPHELSGGQQQRVAVVRSLASRPSVVLADEPTANLDAETSEGLIDLMELLNQEHKVTFLFATHDPLVMSRAHRLVKLRSGLVLDDEVRQTNGNGGNDAAAA